MKKALLLSGGMDSTSIAHWKRPDLAIAVDYGQKPAKTELRVARVIADNLRIPLEVVSVDCSSLGSGDLAGTRQVSLAPTSEWWPFRNQLLVTLALMAAVKHGVQELMIGTVASDSSHADGRPEFIEAVDALTRLQEGGIRVTAPALHLTTVELIRVSSIPKNLLAWAHSCHTGNLACGACRGCVKYRETYQELGDGAF